VSVEVDGLVEAAGSITFDFNGRPVFLREREGDRPGTIVRAGHPMVAEHPEAFRPLVLEPAFDDDR
jgi:hypothetical protein